MTKEETTRLLGYWKAKCAKPRTERIGRGSVKDKRPKWRARRELVYSRFNTPKY